MADGGKEANRKLRIVQWATGYVGAHTLKKVIEHPNLELVGLYVFSESKAGKDAGDLVGLPPTGIEATRDIDAIIALKPDCVLYMQEGVNYDDVCRLLESGANIVTTRAEFHYGAKLDPEIRDRVDAACRKGNSSIHATGSSPGFITEALPIVLTSIQQRVDSIEINEYANMVDGCSPFMLFETMGYGKPPTTFDETRLGMVHNGFRQSLLLLGDALGKPLDEIVASADTACATRPIEIPGEGGGTIQPGTLAAERVTLTGMHQGKPFITFRANWYCSLDIDADWPLREVGWRVEVKGDCPMNVDIHFPIPKEDMFATLGGYTSHRPINAIRAVVAAPPGMVSTADLPQVIVDAGGRPRMSAETAEWVSLTREEPVDPKRRIVDAHHHLWGEGQGLAGAPAYLSQHLLADMAGHNVVASVYVECTVNYRSDGPEHLRVVGETEFAAGEARRSAATRAPILGIVANADLALGEDKVQEVLDAHVAAGGGLFRGIRQLPGGHGGGPARDLLAEPHFREGVAQLGRAGFSLDAFAMHTQLPELARFAREVPGTTLILNHIGMPIYRPGEDSREEVMAVWREGMRAVAGSPNVVVKLGGIGMDMMFGMGWSKQDKPPTSDAVAAWWGDDIRCCIDTFGPDRCLFESNFPVDRWGMGYTVLWNAFQKMAAGYADAEQEALFSGTAIRAYRLDLPEQR